MDNRINAKAQAGLTPACRDELLDNLCRVAGGRNNIKGLMNRNDHEFDVCLSFAGEQRDYVDEVARELKAYGISFFYDQAEKVTLWGKELLPHLDEIYQHKCQYCIPFISKEYAEKRWTIHEFKSALERAFREKREYILPARFDNTKLPGLRDTISYIDLRHVSPKELATVIREKLGNPLRRNYMPPVLDRLFEDLGVNDDSEIQEPIQKIAMRFFGVLQELTDEERDTVLNLFRYRCALEYPDKIHAHSDMLRRRTGKSLTAIKQDLSNLRSLGFECSFRRLESEETLVHGEILGESHIFELCWSDLNVDNKGEYPELIVACAMIDGATEDLCENCGGHFLNFLNFSQLSHATASSDAH